MKTKEEIKYKNIITSNYNKIMTVTSDDSCWNNI